MPSLAVTFDVVSKFAKRDLTIEKILSGGQTGVDRAALDVALEMKIPCGGWCPRGRRAEDGTIAFQYPLQETTNTDYSQRTKWNVWDADGTLILNLGKLTGGTSLTKSFALQQGKPCFVVELNQPPHVAPVVDWLETHAVHVLNIAGPRASTSATIYEEAVKFLRELFETGVRV